MYEVTHTTLDEALIHILKETLGHNNVAYEDGQWVTSIDPTPSDVIYWTYDDGFLSINGDDHTRLMDPYELINEPDHLRYHFTEQIEALEAGELSALTFEFALVDQDVEDHASDCDLNTDEIMDHYDECELNVGYVYVLYTYK